MSRRVHPAAAGDALVDDLGAAAGSGTTTYAGRDRCALRLLFGYGLRKDTLRRIQFKHFDRRRQRLTIFTKGAKARLLPIVEDGRPANYLHHALLIS
jgi:site-specific recombinase XerC